MSRSTPLASDIIIDVAACLEEATYSSGFSYLLELKVEHVTRGFTVDASMKRLLDRCKASIERGLGAQSKARTFELQALQPPPKGAAGLAMRSLVIATWWLLRDIELSNVRIHMRHIRLAKHEATLFLPVSKMDTRGVGPRRTWPCMCGRRLGQG